MKKNLYKIIAIIFVLILALSVGYYYVVFLPNLKMDQNVLSQSKYEQQQKEKCFKLGSEVNENKKNELDGGGSLFEPEFYFNKKLNTCLYFGGFITDKFVNKYVQDVYTNKDIITYMSLDGKSLHDSGYCGSTCVSNEEFLERKNILFNQ